MFLLLNNWTANFSMDEQQYVLSRKPIPFNCFPTLQNIIPQIPNQHVPLNDRSWKEGKKSPGSASNAKFLLIRVSIFVIRAIIKTKDGRWKVKPRALFVYFTIRKPFDIFEHLLSIYSGAYTNRYSEQFGLCVTLFHLPSRVTWVVVWKSPNGYFTVGRILWNVTVVDGNSIGK